MCDSNDVTRSQPDDEAAARMSLPDYKHPLVEEIELTPLTTKGELVVFGAQDAPGDSRPSRARRFIFIATVVIPMLCAVVYLFFIASDRYASEASFMVRSTDSVGGGTGALAAMVQGDGPTRADDETYAVNGYMVSRDMVDLLVRNDHLRDILSPPEADFINRFPNIYSRDNKEGIYGHFQHFVEVWTDGTTGISTLRVVAFRPADANALATAILKHAEERINRLNERAYSDAERYARAVVDASREHVAGVEAQLTDFRNKVGSVDPGRESAAVLDKVGQMRTELAVLETQLSQKLELAPLSPDISSLREKIRASRAQIDKEKLLIVGNSQSLATTLGEFEALTLERQLAARELESAVDGLAKARQAARQQHLYLETIVEPNVADEAKYPRRLLWSLLTLAACLAVFAIASSVHSNIQDHRP